ncbi:uncharacterized protein LOC128644989 isoform X2 [Bombina bombina]|nr:uncharacterized protein LOC128644989 isoform X2 [Bombina bombina]XP_053553668.1 uncharacterized protein LOC128644989 isoform X2 [Bombina bombina]
MKSARLCIGALLYTLISVLPLASGAVLKKPYGVCPLIAAVSVDCLRPLNECQGDGDCSSIEKCCFNGCRMECTRVAAGFPLVPTFKPPKPPVWPPDVPEWPHEPKPIPPNFPPPKPPIKPLKPPIYYDPINDPILKPYVPPIPINRDDSSEPNLPPILIEPNGFGPAFPNGIGP